MFAVESTQPCGVEAKLWRECLKEFDYGPDRSRGACETQRGQYYTCIKTWRERQESKATGAKVSTDGKQQQQRQQRQSVYSYTDFEMVPECGHDAEKLHHCMMMNAFEVSRCQQEMTVLKRCAAKHDKEVRRYLHGDPAIVDYENSIDNSTGLRRLWYKAIGKL